MGTVVSNHELECKLMTNSLRYRPGGAHWRGLGLLGCTHTPHLPPLKTKHRGNAGNMEQCARRWEYHVVSTSGEGN